MPFATWRDQHTEEHTMDLRAHRIQLGQAAAEQLTQYLHTLSADAWHHPSACAGWEVCDVVGHLALGAEFYASTVVRGVQGDTAPPAGAPLPLSVVGVFCPTPQKGILRRLEREVVRDGSLC